jgi:hypothetical protein
MRKAMGAYNRALALKEFDLTSVVSQYMNIYKNLIGARLEGWAAPVAAPAPVREPAVVPRNAARAPRAATQRRYPRPSARLEPQEVQSEIRS